ADGDLVGDARGAVDRVIQDDGHVTTHGPLGELGEVTSTGLVEGDVDLRLAGLSHAPVCGHQGLAGQRDPGLDHVGEVARALALGGRPREAVTADEDLTTFGILALDVAEEGLPIRPEKLGVTVLGRQLDPALGGRGGVADRLLGPGAGLVDHPELELRGGSDERLGLLGILLSGEGDLDGVGAELADVHLGHAPPVDAAADDHHGLLNGLFLELLDARVVEGNGQGAGTRRDLGEVRERREQVLLHGREGLGLGRADGDLQLLRIRLGADLSEVLVLEVVHQLDGATLGALLERGLRVDAHDHVDAALEVEPQVQAAIRRRGPRVGLCLNGPPVSALLRWDDVVGDVGWNEEAEGEKDHPDDDPEACPPGAIHHFSSFFASFASASAFAGSSLTLPLECTADLSTRTRTPAASSRISTFSRTSWMRANSPPWVTTSSPFFSEASSSRC